MFSLVQNRMSTEVVFGLILFSIILSFDLDYYEEFTSLKTVALQNKLYDCPSTNNDSMNVSRLGSDNTTGAHIQNRIVSFMVSIFLETNASVEYRNIFRLCKSSVYVYIEEKTIPSTVVELLVFVAFYVCVRISKMFDRVDCKN